jgi:hypothetical protein
MNFFTGNLSSDVLLFQECRVIGREEGPKKQTEVDHYGDF